MFGRWLGARVRLDPADADRLAKWRRLTAPEPSQALAATRFVVVDVESSGLDVRRDRLISIGALAVEAGTIDFAQAFETILRQEAPSSKENILVHGIGGSAQREGVPAAQGLLDFLAFAGADPLVAFHAEFDRAMIGRALRRTLRTELRAPWLDLAILAPALLRDRAPHAKTLDDWQAALAIRNYSRHNALADTLATAELLLFALASAATHQLSTLGDLIATERGERWLARR